MKTKQRRVEVTMFCLLAVVITTQAQPYRRKTGSPQPNTVQFIFTSDVHFGLTKENFQEQQNVSSAMVNTAMIKQMNRLPGLLLPDDNGVNSNKPVHAIDAVVITGDITNREEMGVQTATVSWKEFKKDYEQQLRLTTYEKKPALLLVTPGNHDASNAIGFRRPLQPLKDPAAMIGIYNLEMHPEQPRNASNYNFQKNKIHYSLNIRGIHFMFVSLWPDSAERIWMAGDLAKVKTSTPVLVFTHSMPDVEARFFINPNGAHDINDSDKFENLVSERLKDGSTIKDTTIIEQKALENFLHAHPNIKAYFHGHSNYTEFYNWKGPAGSILLHCFRADSPMKGKYSAQDETKLSFILVSIDPIAKKLTARECLWNSDPHNPEKLPVWGQSISVPIL